MGAEEEVVAEHPEPEGAGEVVARHLELEGVGDIVTQRGCITWSWRGCGGTITTQSLRGWGCIFTHRRRWGSSITNLRPNY